MVFLFFSLFCLGYSSMWKEKAVLDTNLAEIFNAEHHNHHQHFKTPRYAKIIMARKKHFMFYLVSLHTFY